MKRILIRTFSLAAMVGMTAVLTNAVRAEGSALEGAKQESGIKFGEMSGLKARGDSSAVSASGDGVSRSALTVGKLDIKAKGRPQIPSPELAGATTPEKKSSVWRRLGEALSTIPERVGRAYTKHPVIGALVGGVAAVGAFIGFVSVGVVAPMATAIATGVAGAATVIYLFTKYIW